MLTATYIAIGTAFVWMLSIPHRRDGHPYVPVLVWVAVALTWPLMLPVWLIYIVRVALRNTKH